MNHEQFGITKRALFKLCMPHRILPSNRKPYVGTQWTKQVSCVGAGADTSLQQWLLRHVLARPRALRLW